jgi:hypothetical protein
MEDKRITPPFTIDMVKQAISRKGNIQTPKSVVGECGNGWRYGVGLPLAQSFKLQQMLMGK